MLELALVGAGGGYFFPAITFIEQVLVAIQIQLAPPRLAAHPIPAIQKPNPKQPCGKARKN